MKSKSEPKLLQVVEKIASPADGQRSPEFSDDALALRFTKMFADEKLYVASWSRWLNWDGRRYEHDEILKVFDDIRSVNRAAALECNEPRQSKLIASAQTVTAVERLSRSDPHFATRASEFDRDPWLLNTPDGAVDLRTNEVRPASREDRFTKITAVGPGRPCPRWRAFLREITDGDSELESYLARVFGYSLTGSTREHAFFFCYGLGANGKTVCVETIARLLGDYAMPAPIDMFMASKFQAHSTDVAGLQGARMITASENEAGRPLAEARIKLLTGGEKVSARRMRADNTNFEPQFKLFMAGNHKPRVTSNDEAIRRRVQLIPFNKTIPVWQRDRQLPEKLRDEWPGILSWAMDGCADWVRQGLNPPPCVRQATDEYLNAEDMVLAWLNAEVDLDPNARASTADLFGSWAIWAKAANEEIGPQKELVKALESKGLVLDHTREGNRWLGVRLKRDKTQ